MDTLRFYVDFVVGQAINAEVIGASEDKAACDAFQRGWAQLRLDGDSPKWLCMNCSSVEPGSFREAEHYDTPPETGWYIGQCAPADLIVVYISVAESQATATASAPDGTRYSAGEWTREGEDGAWWYTGDAIGIGRRIAY